MIRQRRRNNSRVIIEEKWDKSVGCRILPWEVFKAHSDKLSQSMHPDNIIICLSFLAIFMLVGFVCVIDGKNVFADLPDQSNELQRSLEIGSLTW
ncbi:hypothetical protein CEXT_346491 [Caerostris extrusa]|uniref:Uncharacterized protein n=1 Tax=Caerostris extrusa TaxID=172846 RepID=A0AAV4WRN7_CAEEX|nr:hypothetical protein CEXT_346491 [Caerostris extrusa]